MQEQVQIKLPEVIAALSLVTDLANGNPPETTLRICYIALETAGAMGLKRDELADLYYASLLRFIGCTAYAHEEANATGGDDVAFRNSFARADSSKSSELLGAGMRLGNLRSRPAILWNLITKSSKMQTSFATANCEVACMLGAKIGMPAGVLRALAEVHERWDGRGNPRKIRGDALSLAVRILHLANSVEIIRQAAGAEFACDVIRKRSAGQFDPEVCKVFLKIGPDLLKQIELVPVWEEVLNRAPRNESSPGPARLRQIAEAFGSFVDLKSTYTAGRSAQVALLAENAARQMGLSDVEGIYIAALLSDVGMVGLPNGILEKKGKLSISEWERVRLHTYYTERVLLRSPVLGKLAPIASGHQERMDGSGYHRGLIGKAIPIGGRLLAEADVYHALLQRRPYRNSYSPDEAARLLHEDVRSGKIDGTCADAVLSVVGLRLHQESGSTRSSLLSPRESEVLKLLAQGHSNKEIGESLGISHRTVQHHVEHIYNKVAVSTRAAATLYAAQNGFLDPTP